MKYTETFTSCTNTHVTFDLYLPLVMIRYKAIIQIHHGMCEYSGRYQKLAEFLSEEGYVVVVSDFPGHGYSLYDYEQGYFGSGDACQTLVKDMLRLRQLISARYSDLPYFILGNQLGSLVLRQFMAIYGDFIEGAIIMGTSDTFDRLSLGKRLVQMDSLVRGSMHRSKTVQKAFTTHLNANFLPIKTSIDYLTSDPQERQRYLEDPMTNFTYTNRAYKDMLNLVHLVSKDTMVKLIPKYLSVFIISGKKDVFGNMGKGPSRLYEKYKKQGISDLELKLYDDSRHDILHELNRKEVFKDLLKWLNERTYT